MQWSSTLIYFICLVSNLSALKQCRWWLEKTSTRWGIKILWLHF